jgi:putative transposase
MTIEDLEGIIYEALIVYENEPHEGIGAIPARLWADGIKRHGRPFIDDINALDTLLAATAEVSVTRAGVRFRGMRFHDQANTTRLLNDLVAYQPKKSQSDKTYVTGRVRAKIKYQPGDCSRIEVWNPVSKEYLTLGNRDERFSAGLSFWAADRVRAFARHLDLEFQTDEQRWDARDALRQHYEAFMPAQKVGTTRDARRFVAQEQAELVGDGVIHAAAPASYDGNAAAINIAQDLMHQTRLDGDSMPDGVLRNPAKAAKTRKASKERKAKLDAVHAALKSPTPIDGDEMPKPLFVPGRGVGAVVPTVGAGWNAR